MKQEISESTRIRFGVIGAGPAGLAIYAMLVASSHTARLYCHKGHRAHLDPILTNNSRFELAGYPTDHPLPLSLELLPAQWTSSLPDLIENSDVLLNTTPIGVHDEIYEQIDTVCRARERGVLLIHLGGGFSVFSHLAAGSSPVRLASCHTLPFASRVDRTTVKLLNVRRHTPVWLSDSIDRPVISLLKDLLGGDLQIYENPLEGSIDRSSYVMHPVVTMFNVTRIENGEGFYFYKDGFSGSIYRILIAAGQERQALASMLGFGRFPSPQARLAAFQANYSADFSVIRGPDSVQHRFITEDIPFGLVPICTLAETLGLAMPVCRSIVEIASTVAGTDFWNSRYNLHQAPNLRRCMLAHTVTVAP
jgi:opine dehydrogenase